MICSVRPVLFNGALEENKGGGRPSDRPSQNLWPEYDDGEVWDRRRSERLKHRTTKLEKPW